MSQSTRLRCFALLVLLAGTSVALHAEPLRFSAMGCGPYKPEEYGLLEKQLQLVAEDNKSEFLIHLGDIVTGTKKVWPESEYKKVADTLRQAKVPTFVVLGDNEYNDLDKPEDGLRFWRAHFLHFDKQFKYDRTIHRQKVRDENFAWTSKGVLLIGINLPGGRVHDKAEWTKRMQDDADWTQDALRKWKKDVRAAVVLAQAAPAKDHEPFFKAFGEQSKEFGKPVLYLHADGHIWQMQKRYRVPNLTRVQTDMIGKAPPVLVTVTDDATFEFDRRLTK